MKTKFKPSAALLAALPDEVPIPSADQFGKRRRFDPATKQCCLVGWCQVVTHGRPYHYNDGEHDVAWELAKLISGSHDPFEWNDDRRRSPETVARRYEQKMRELGYDIEESP